VVGAVSEQPLVSHGNDGLWLTTFHVCGEVTLHCRTVLTIKMAEKLIRDLHQGIADEMSGNYGSPDRGEER
jgi:hypothetical protein